MYCPKCGQTLERDETGAMYCRQGEMGLSRLLEEALTQRFAADAPAQSPEPLFDPLRHGGIHWYCPRCGGALNTHLECERCCRHLRDLVFPLVEWHPHCLRG